MLDRTGHVNHSCFLFDGLITKLINEGKVMDVICLDFIKAFDNMLFFGEDDEI